MDLEVSTVLTLQILAIGAALCAFFGWFRFSGGRIARVVLAVAIAAIAASAFWAQSSGRLRSMGGTGQLNMWGVYHHYLGSKYFSELGYTELYKQTLAADAEGRQRLKEITKTRDLSTYKVKEVDRINDVRRSPAFSDERWKEFKKDVDYLLKSRGMALWHRVIKDRGYNCSPAWNFMAWSLFKVFSIQNPASQTFLVLLDIFLVLISFGLSVRAYGLTRSLLVLSGFFLWFGNSHIFGEIFLLDWFAACWAGVSAWRLGWLRTSGALLAYAAMVRVFPAAFFLGPIVAAGRQLMRTRRLDARYRRFFVSAFLSAAVLFALGGVHTSQGFGAWKKFASEIVFHTQQHVEGNRRLGLEHIFTIDLSNGLSKKLDNDSAGRLLEKRKFAFRAVQLMMLALLLLAMRKADEHDALLLGVSLVFIGTIASRYYGTVFLLLLFLGFGGGSTEQPARQPQGPRLPFLILDSAVFLLISAAWALEAAGANNYTEYVFANVLLSVWFTVLLGFRAFGSKIYKEHP